jgi:hypothetical protein
VRFPAFRAVNPQPPVPPPMAPKVAFAWRNCDST